MNYLLDTNICMYIINNKFEYLKKKIEAIGLEEIGISTLTIAELEYGIEKSQSRFTDRNRNALLKFLIPFAIVPFDQSDTTYYASIRNQLQKSGQIIGNMDLLIAAQAVARDVILVTNNEREFQRIPELKLENWVEK
jgi:tRNA(fMet)-specific endonuclease VapC